ncbi:MAG TPA: hypothetical protein PKC49_00770 [Phycisphaerae bacterium]|nr:hypothetical protein [Phycisphaerae bacterium]
MEANRRAITGLIEWSVVQVDTREMQLVSRYANNGDYVFEVRGTPAGGWTAFNADGQPTSRMPQLYMRNSIGFWRYGETSFGADVYDASYIAAWDLPVALDRDVRDFRGVGILPTTGHLAAGDGLAALATLASADWSEQRVGNLVVVAARTPDQGLITWELDPTRDWNPVRVCATQGGAVIYEAISELKQYGDVWLPSSVQYIVGGEPNCRVHVRSATVSRGGGPQEFTPTDLRIEPGVNINIYVAEDVSRTTPRPAKPLAWTGRELIPLQRFFQEVKEGRLPKPTIFDRYAKSGRYAGPYLMPAEAAQLEVEYKRTLQERDIRVHEQLWERYVRDFIKRFQLTDEQSATAWRVHMACVGQAREYVERNNKRLVDALGKLNEARDANDADKLTRAKEAWQELQQPIQRVFDEQLKPRLEKLPTRAQRAAAEQKDHAVPAPAEPKKP